MVVIILVSSKMHLQTLMVHKLLEERISLKIETLRELRPHLWWLEHIYQDQMSQVCINYIKNVNIYSQKLVNWTSQ